MENLKSLNAKEISQINGGSLLAKYTPIGIAAWLGYELMTNWSDVKSGIADGYSDGIDAINNN